MKDITRIPQSVLIDNITYLWLASGVIKHSELVDAICMLESHTTEELLRIYLDAAKANPLLAHLVDSEPPPPIYGVFCPN